MYWLRLKTKVKLISPWLKVSEDPVWIIIYPVVSCWLLFVATLAFSLFPEGGALHRMIFDHRLVHPLSNHPPTNRWVHRPSGVGGRELFLYFFSKDSKKALLISEPSPEGVFVRANCLFYVLVKHKIKIILYSEYKIIHLAKLLLGYPSPYCLPASLQT